MLTTGELCVCQMTAVLDLAASTVSGHLADLRAAGLVHERKEGKWVHYRLADDPELSAVIRNALTLLAGDHQADTDAAAVRHVRRLARRDGERRRIRSGRGHGARQAVLLPQRAGGAPVPHPHGGGLARDGLRWSEPMGRLWDIPDSIAAAGDLRPGDDLWAEPTRDGVVVRSDSLRKVYVEATGRCNLQCAMCPRQAWAAGSGDMTAEVFDALLSGLPDVPPDRFTLAFGGFGEPTVHPRFLDMVAQARQARCRVELITNGTTMTGEFAQDLAALGVAQVTVSVDGGSDEAYSAMRGIDRDAALDAVARLREHARRGPHRMSVGVACVATRRTVTSLPALIATAQRLKLDFVSISNVVPHTREMADEALFTYAGQVSNMDPGTWRPRADRRPLRLQRVDAPAAGCAASTVADRAAASPRPWGVAQPVPVRRATGSSPSHGTGG